MPDSKIKELLERVDLELANLNKINKNLEKIILEAVVDINSKPLVLK